MGGKLQGGISGPGTCILWRPQELTWHGEGENIIYRSGCLAVFDMTASCLLSTGSPLHPPGTTLVMWEELFFIGRLSLSKILPEPGLPKTAWPGSVDVRSVLRRSWTAGSVIPHSCVLQPHSRPRPYTPSVAGPFRLREETL